MHQREAEERIAESATSSPVGPATKLTAASLLTLLYASRIYMCDAGSQRPSPSANKKMDRERPIERFLPLRPVEFHVLLSLAAGERHGYGIIQDAEARGEADVPDVGTLYRALRRMEDQGLIESAERREAADAVNERRHYYRIADLGLRVARAEARRLAGLARAAQSSGLLEAGAW